MEHVAGGSRPVAVRPAPAALRSLALAALLAVPAALTAVVAYRAGTGFGWLAGLTGAVAVHLLIRIFWGALLGRLLPLVAMAQVVLAVSAGTVAPDLALRQHGTRLVATVIVVDAVAGTHGHTDYQLLDADLQALEVHSSGRPRYAVGDHATVLLDPRGRLEPTLLADTGLGWALGLDIVTAAALLVLAYLVVATPWAGDRRRLLPAPRSRWRAPLA